MKAGNSKPRRAMVIGAGIGGLCTAIALRNEGWQVALYERSPGIPQVGAGIVLAANAMKALCKLGAADQVQAQGAPIGKAEIRTWDGKLLVDLPTTQQAMKYGTSSYIIHRVTLQSILLDVLGTTADVQFNKKLVGWTQDQDLVTATFADGCTEAGELLIGADGIRSEVRRQLPELTPLRYSGFTALRGISVFEDQRYPLGIGGGFEAWGHGKRFGFTHLGNGRIYWFAAINSREGIPHPAAERKQLALSTFRGWYQPIESVIAAAEEDSILSHDIYDCSPIGHWTKGRVALLGDAAHPMLPNLGQGGAQAMEDALVLAQCLHSVDNDIPAALQQYEQRRLARATKVVRQSRLMAKVVQTEIPAAIFVRNRLLRMIPPSMHVKRFDWLVGYEV
ncbi:FAD-dependent monooxygenase [Paenibacillus periandrae]|uniref:FAD-dependent monooxygenase n=1 Tax=Paenibacillus periandrae TaxID=1761741 RepID=UPI001F09F649|nr:FAD-dependent monooxygenase [Paenibacillus periandrae]